MNQPKNFVSADDAKNLLSKVGGLTKSSGSSKFAEIENLTQVSDSAGNAIFYAVNYQGGGFILLAADNRIDLMVIINIMILIDSEDPAKTTNYNYKRTVVYNIIP